MVLIPNQFGQQVVTGMLDLRYNPSTVSVEIDASEPGTLVAGQSVKLIDSAGGVPKVVATTADTDVIFGFINFDGKLPSYKALDKCEISTMHDNVMYLTATAAIGRGAPVRGVVATPGGVAPGTGANTIGWAYDKATAAGQLIRVVLNLPSSATA